MAIWGYSELDSLLDKNPMAHNGFLVDTNILVSATYDSDKFHDDSAVFIEKIINKNIPLYCNVNIRSEFLEIHRRILFSEAILDFERQCSKSLLPTPLVNSLTIFRNKYERRMRDKPNETPYKLGESEIKEFKITMDKIIGNEKDLWTELCEDRIGTKLVDIWSETESALGLNFLSLRKEDQDLHLTQKPEWEGVTELISKHGLSSSDAMILNMFLSSKFEVIASSDADISLTIKRLGLQHKHCISPDELKKQIQ